MRPSYFRTENKKFGVMVGRRGVREIAWLAGEAAGKGANVTEIGVAEG